MSETRDLHAEEALGKAYDARQMRRLLGYLRPYRGATAAAVALIILSSLLQLVGPLATAVALDLFVVPGSTGGPRAGASRWVAAALARWEVSPEPVQGLAGDPHLGDLRLRGAEILHGEELNRGGVLSGQDGP